MADKPYEPILLTDKSRLQEIYDLRIAAWENSERICSINKTKFPNGWVEEIDKDAFHFVVFDDSNKIVASARISLHNSLDELPYPSAFRSFNLPTDRPLRFILVWLFHQIIATAFYLKNLTKSELPS